MFRKADIRSITIAVHRERFRDVLYELGRQELVHISGKEWEVQEDEMHGPDWREDEEIRPVLSDLERLFRELNITLQEEDGPVLDRQVLMQRNGDLDREYLDNISGQIEELKKRRESILAVVEDLSSRRTILSEIAETGVDMKSLGAMNMCSPVFGKITTDRDTVISGFPVFISRYGRYVLAITMPGYRQRLLESLRGSGFHDMTDIAGPPEAMQSSIREMEQKLAGFSADLDGTAVELAALGESYRSGLVEMYNAYTALDRTLEARKNFMVSDSVVFIRGWLAAESVPAVESLLRSLCGSGFFLMVQSRSESWRFIRELPVVLKNNTFFRAFELLVRNAGTPANSEVDPTPVAALFYILMFGIMFGDVGQGLVVALAGLILRIYGLRKGGDSRLLQDAGIIMISIGLSGAVFGLLYGSVFSNEHCLPALWFHPMENMMSLFSAVVIAGAFFIALGIVLNSINKLLYGNTREALLSTRGLPGLVLYSGLVFFIIRYIQSGEAPSSGEALFIVAPPLTLILFRNIFAFMFFGLKRPFPGGIFEYVMETAVELIEMASGFLSHSISFVRAAAFALSHAGLGMAIYSLAGMVSTEISPASLAIIVVGNVFIILLEGLVCGIQALRLEYYEFFGNFYQGDGVPFQPFSLRGVQQYH